MLWLRGMSSPVQDTSQGFILCRNEHLALSSHCSEGKGHQLVPSTQAPLASLFVGLSQSQSDTPARGAEAQLWGLGSPACLSD
jgi:hypothetical protein